MTSTEAERQIFQKQPSQSIAPRTQGESISSGSVSSSADNASDPSIPGFTKTTEVAFRDNIVVIK